MGYPRPYAAFAEGDKKRLYGRPMDEWDPLGPITPWRRDHLMTGSWILHRGEKGGRDMLMMVRPRARDGSADAKAEQLRLLCAFCGKAFTALEHAYLSYAAPTVETPVQPRWSHRTCAQRQRPTPKLWRGDFALRALIT